LYVKDILFDKKDHIAYWADTAKKDWKAVNDLYLGKNYAQALFFAHLVLEKLLKAHWVKDNDENTPPKTHNLIAILSKTKYIKCEINQFLNRSTQ
jgi:HEPN domain-containing protein